jgi:hypothetical protein
MYFSHNTSVLAAHHFALGRRTVRALFTLPGYSLMEKADRA